MPNKFLIVAILISSFFYSLKALSCGCTPLPHPGGSEYYECEERIKSEAHRCVVTNYCKHKTLVNAEYEPGDYCIVYFEAPFEYGGSSTNFDDTYNVCGSVIKVDNQSFLEEMPITGTGLNLVYSSERSLGRLKERTLRLSFLRGFLTTPIRIKTFPLNTILMES